MHTLLCYKYMYFMKAIKMYKSYCLKKFVTLWIKFDM